MYGGGTCSHCFASRDVGRTRARPRPLARIESYVSIVSARLYNIIIYIYSLLFYQPLLPRRLQWFVGLPRAFGLRGHRRPHLFTENHRTVSFSSCLYGTTLVCDDLFCFVVFFFFFRCFLRLVFAVIIMILFPAAVHPPVIDASDVPTYRRPQTRPFKSSPAVSEDDRRERPDGSGGGGGVDVVTACFVARSVRTIENVEIFRFRTDDTVDYCVVYNRKEKKLELISS